MTGIGNRIEPRLRRAFGRAAALFAALFACAWLTLADASAKELSLIVGKAFVSDGNTIEIKGQRIKLFGVDAPDRGQTCVNKKGGAYPCGLRAAFALDRLAKGKTIYCEPRGVDNEKRVIAACSMAGLDLSGAMVETGWAIADLRYTDAYVEIETVARDAGLGLWAGDFDDPAQWRRAKKAAVTAPPTN